MAFMQPTATYFTAKEAAEYVPTEHGDDAPGAGWYGRLSAAGYLDCTEWEGPFASELEALAYVCDLYEVDADGNDLDDDGDDIAAEAA